MYFILYRDTTYLNNWNNSASRKPLIVRGARQVGKSTLVRVFAKAAGLRLTEINLEKHPLLNTVFKSLNVQRITEELETISQHQLNDSDSLLFLDEIQATPHALAALRYFYEERPKLRVIAAGSLLEFALADKDFSMPVGRVEYLWVRPMSFFEFLMACDQKFLAKKIISYKIGQPWPVSLHTQIEPHFRWYLIIGGMPEAVAAFVGGGKEIRIRNIHDNIIAAYSDDFSKYATKSNTVTLQQIFRRLPISVGKKIKYSEILPGEKSSIVRNCVDLLAKANIITRVYHTNCSGIPLQANIDLSSYKVYWLDSGLLNRMQGLTWESWKIDQTLSYEGVLAEQFVAQEILAEENSSDPPPLCYWLREGRKGNAEVDFVIQNGNQILPIEVKSGASGSLKSLAQLLYKIQGKKGVKVANSPPSEQSVSIQVTVDGKLEILNYQLFEIPHYLVLALVKQQ